MKKRFTKLMAMLLAGAMVLSLAACGKSSEEASAPAAAESATTAETVDGEKVLTAAISTAWDTMMPLNTTSN